MAWISSCERKRIGSTPQHEAVVVRIVSKGEWVDNCRKFVFDKRYFKMIKYK